MDAADQFIYGEGMQVCEHVLGEAKKQSTENVVAESSHYLYQRILNGVRTLHVLSEHAQHAWGVDGGSIVRTIYDATLQLLWLLHDPARREHRAAMYRDYIHVERFRMLSGIKASGTDFASTLAELDHSSDFDEWVRQRLLSVGTQFLKENRRRQHEERGDPYPYDPTAHRSHWYPDHHTLRDLAKEVGYAGEYEILHHATSASVHSSRWALWPLFRHTAVNEEYALQRGLHFCLRAAGAVAESLGIPLADNQIKKTERAKDNIFDKPKPPLPEVDQ